MSVMVFLLWLVRCRYLRVMLLIGKIVVVELNFGDMLLIVVWFVSGMEVMFLL